MRPVPGLHGIDFLAQNAVAKAQSYVFAHVVRALIDFGYFLFFILIFLFDFFFPFLVFIFS